MFSQDELDAALCYAFYLAKSHGSVKNLFIFFFPIVVLAALFVYFIMGGLPAFGAVLVPLTGILLLFCIFFFPIVYAVLIDGFNNSSNLTADRFTVKITGDANALISAINKIRTLQGTSQISDNKLVRKMLNLKEKRYRKRIIKLEKMQI